MKIKTTAIQTMQFQSALGAIRLASTPSGLAGAWFEGQRHAPTDDEMRDWHRDPAHPTLREAVAQFTASFAGERAHFDLPLDLGYGTDFQQAVWRALLALPRGGTTSYGALSASIGRPKAVRAVGAAVGRNPLSVVVPCHRVIGADGSLTGYAGGLDRKTALLRLEGALPAGYVGRSTDRVATDVSAAPGQSPDHPAALAARYQIAARR